MKQRTTSLMGDAGTGHRFRRLVVLLLCLVSVLAAISLVLLSPAALAALNPNGSTDWQRLADVSQTYAAASAVLALLALDTSSDKRMRRFHEILDEEHQKATRPNPSPESGPPESEPEEPESDA